MFKKIIQSSAFSLLILTSLALLSVSQAQIPGQVNPLGNPTPGNTVNNNTISNNTANLGAGPYVAGSAVLVKWKGSWWPAQVVQVGPKRWFIHYDGYNNSWDEWVGPGRIRPR